MEPQFKYEGITILAAATLGRKRFRDKKSFRLIAMPQLSQI